MDHSAVNFGVLIALFVGVWVMIDATRRGKDGFSAFLWGFATFLVLCIFLPLWLIFRPAIPEAGGGSETGFYGPFICPTCGQQTDRNKAYCDHCGRAIWDKKP